MKKILIGVIAFGSLFVSACSNQQTQGKVSSTHSKAQQKQSSPAHLADIISYFKQKGFTIGAKSQKAYTMIGAIDGFAITINKEPIELYEFDPSQKNATLDQVKKTGKLIQNKAVTNGDFLLVEDNTDPEQTNIEKAFIEFK